MRILVFGATGPTGLEVVSQGLEHGHDVTAFVRDPGRLGPLAPRVRVAVGDVTRAQSALAVDAAMQGRDAVVSALGVRAALRSGGLMASAMRAIVPAMEAHGVRRIVLVSAMGVGASGRDAPLVPRLMYRLLLGDIFADKQAAEDRVRASGLEWTFVYPTGLTNGPRTGAYRAGERLGLRGFPTISRADVADFVLRELESPRFVRRVAVVSG
jgi:putative NADH-flavin reductase